MELEINEKKISIEKDLTKLDEFVIKFIKNLDKNNINYVLVSDYIAILFGRSRSTEDVDILIEKVNEKTFLNLWNDLIKDLYCLNTDNQKEAYEYLKDKVSIRFAEKNKVIPNMKIKFITTEIDKFCLNDKILVQLNNISFYISNIELQIAFKIWLSSDKDLEDAQHLQSIFTKNINKEKLKYFLELLKVKDKGVLNEL